MVKSLPKKLTKHFKEVMVLVDTGFGSVQFIQGVRKDKYHIIAGIARTRKLIDGRCVAQLHKRGQQLRLQGLKFPVSSSWYYFKRHDGKYEKRFVISTKALKARAIFLRGANEHGEPAMVRSLRPLSSSMNCYLAVIAYQLSQISVRLLRYIYIEKLNKKFPSSPMISQLPNGLLA